MKFGESTRKFVFERIVPLLWSEQSRSKFWAKCPGGIVPGGTGFGANRPGADWDGCKILVYNGYAQLNCGVITIMMQKFSIFAYFHSNSIRLS